MDDQHALDIRAERLHPDPIHCGICGGAFSGPGRLELRRAHRRVAHRSPAPEGFRTMSLDGSLLVAAERF